MESMEFLEFRILSQTHSGASRNPGSEETDSSPLFLPLMLLVQFQQPDVQDKR